MGQLPRVLRAGALLSTLAFPVSGFAEFYIGGGAGQATYKDIQEVESACAGVGATCTADDSDTGFKLFAGYRFGEFFALEGGFIDLGESVANSAPPVAATASFSVQGAFVSLLPQIPIGGVGSIFGRLGLSAVDAELTASGGGLSVSDSTSAPGVVFGVGGEVHLTDAVSVRVEWERHSFDEAFQLAGISVDAPDVDLTSASILFRF